MQIPEVHIDVSLHFSELSAGVTGLKLPTEVGNLHKPPPPPPPPPCYQLSSLVFSAAGSGSLKLLLQDNWASTSVP